MSSGRIQEQSLPRIRNPAPSLSVRMTRPFFSARRRIITRRFFVFEYSNPLVSMITPSTSEESLFLSYFLLHHDGFLDPDHAASPFCRQQQLCNQFFHDDTGVEFGTL